MQVTDAECSRMSEVLPLRLALCSSLVRGTGLSRTLSPPFVSLVKCLTAPPGLKPFPPYMHICLNAAVLLGSDVLVNLLSTTWLCNGSSLSDYLASTPLDVSLHDRVIQTSAVVGPAAKLLAKPVLLCVNFDNLHRYGERRHAKLSHGRHHHRHHRRHRHDVVSEALAQVVWWSGVWWVQCRGLCASACVVATRSCVHEWADAWMHGCMDAWMHGCMGAWMDLWCVSCFVIPGL